MLTFDMLSRRWPRADHHLVEVVASVAADTFAKYGLATDIEQAFARLNLAAGADQSRPVVLSNLLGQQHLDAARRIRRVVLGVEPGADGV